jgi:aspartokinase/homoserine dehydrogenase 1
MAASALSSRPVFVHKFGGTSVAGADRYENVARILRSQEFAGSTQGAVVSAMSKVTDALLALVEQARGRDARYEASLVSLRDRHIETARKLLPVAEAERLSAVFTEDARDLKEILRGVWLGKSASELTSELVAGYGEVWSAQLLAAHLVSLGVDAVWLDAREILVVHPAEQAGQGPRIDWTTSQARFDAWRKLHPAELTVITGFVASTPEGVPTTLKRNGSDFSGSIFGALFECQRDPHLDRRRRSALGRPPARARSRGARRDELRRGLRAGVLRRQGAAPAHDGACGGAQHPHPHPQHLQPRAPGLAHHEQGQRSRDAPAAIARAVAGFSTFDGISLVNVEGTGMIGVPGVAQRLFGALRDVGVSVVLISRRARSTRSAWRCPRPRAPSAREDPEARSRPRSQGAIQRWSSCPGRRARRGGRSAWPTRPGWPRPSSPRSPRRASACGPSRRARRAEHLRRHRPRRLHPRAAGGARGLRALGSGDLHRACIGPGSVGKRAAAAARRAGAGAAQPLQGRPAPARGGELESACCSARPR